MSAGRHRELEKSIQDNGRRGAKRRYLVRWYEDGRQRGKRFTTREDAETPSSSRRAGACASGPSRRSSPRAYRLEDFLTAWFERYGPGWVLGTRMGRATVLDRWIVPYLGDVALRDLSRTRLLDWRARILADGASNNRANTAMRELSSALGKAVEEDLIPANPCVGIRRLRHAVTGHRALTPVEVERIRAQLEPRDALVVSLMAYAGLRPEEAFALTWGKVGEVLLVDRAVAEGQLQEDKARRHATVRVCAPLAEDLAAARPPAARYDDLVVVAERGGMIALRFWREKIWHPAADRAGVDAVPYDCRHTFGSLLIHQSDNMLDVQTQMRHASPNTTLKHYAHAFEEWKLRPKISMVDAIREGRVQVAAERAAAASDSTAADPTESPSPSSSAQNLHSDLDDGGGAEAETPAQIRQSGRRGSNPRPRAWEARALPTELHPRGGSR